MSLATTRPPMRRALPWLVVFVVVDLLVVIGRLEFPFVSTTDLATHNWLVAQRTPAGGQIVTAFTDLGRTLPMLVIGVIATGALYARYRRVQVWPIMVLVPIGSVGLTESLKAVFALTRPDTTGAVAPFEDSYSFPSGHTLNSTAIIGALAYLTCWLVGRLWVRVAAVAAAAIWIVAMGLSRVYLGHHWPSDVLLGWSLGLTWLVLVMWAHQLWLTRRNLPQSAALAPH